MYIDHVQRPANELLLSQARAQTGPRRMPSWRQQYRGVEETSWLSVTSYFRDVQSPPRVFNIHRYQTRTATAPTRYQNLLQPCPKHLNPSYIPKHLNLCNSKGLKSFKFKVQAYDKKKKSCNLKGNISLERPRVLTHWGKKMEFSFSPGRAWPRDAKGDPSQEVERDLRLERPAPSWNTDLPLSTTRPGLCS